MIATTQQMLKTINKTLAQATPEENRQLREALLESLCGSRCDICGDEKRTLLLDSHTKTLFCFQCIGRHKTPPVFRRAITDSDVTFLKELKVVWETA